MSPPPLWFCQVENGYTLLVPIFKQFHKNIIGKGGANIKKVRNQRWAQLPPPAFYMF